MIARALGSLAEFRTAARAYLLPSGRAIAMQSVQQAEATEGGSTIAYTLPDGSDRRLRIIPAADL